MVKENAKKNGRKKSLERLSQIETSEISEIIKCYLVDYKADGTPMLIYEKVSDSTIHGAWIHPDTDLKLMKKIIKKNTDDPWRLHVWISLCKGFSESEIGRSAQFFIRHVAESLDDIEEIPVPSISTEEAVRRTLEGLSTVDCKM